MATSNEEIRDAALRRQIFYLRFAGGLRRRIVRLLDRAEPELRARIKARIERAARIGFDPGPVTTSRFERRIAAIEAVIRDENKPIFQEIKDMVRSELLALAAADVNFMRDAVIRNLPVDLTPSLPSNEVLRSVVFKRPFQGRVLKDWLNQYEANDRRRMMAAIRIGVVNDETPTEISRRIFGTRSLGGRDGVREITRRGAQTLAQTATSAITNGAHEEFYKKNARFIDQELYVATLDSRTTPICRALDGETFPVGKGPRPPLHMNCRSVRVPVIDGRTLSNRPAVGVSKTELDGLSPSARRKAIDRAVGQVPGDQSYQVWLKNQSNAFQDEVLGPTRAKLFRSGEVTLDGFVDRTTGRQFTLDELSAREGLALNGV